ncbi:tetratricopeptide repeat protein [Amycolatopsis lurida]
MTAGFVTLGQVEMRVGGLPVPVGHSRQRCVLAALLFDANRAVPADQLIDRVWGEDAVPGARGALHSYLSRLRKVLTRAGDVRIALRTDGYTLRVDPLHVDVHRLRHLIARARLSEDEEAAARLLEEALELARGEFCAGADTPWLMAVRTSLDQQRHAAELDLVDLKLRAGRHAEVLPELATSVVQRPLDERLAGQYMLALARSGRQADALEHYRRVRSLLAGELGTDPGGQLQQLHCRILTADPVLAGPVPALARIPTPRQLPASPGGFSGREDELARLTELRVHAAEAGVPAVTAVIGGGGVGKTWLVSRWAHDHLDEFPDGQLFVDLQGFTADAPLPSTVAVRGLLQALGVAPASIPVEPQGQIGLFRSLVSGKRMLLVLDNARDTAQVAPLLPGSPSCVVLLTSRHQLPGLLTDHGAALLPLGVLSVSGALTLLRKRVGAARIAAEPDAAAALVEHCARLPLALGIAAARAVARPGFPMAALAAELADESGRLDALATADTGGSVRRVLAGSCRVVDNRTATLLGLLAVVPGPEIGVSAAAALLDTPLDTVREALQNLLAVHLVEEPEPGRHRLHDLVRLYAAERAHTEPAAVDAALRRVTAFYLRTATKAADVLIARERGSEPSPGIPAFGDYRQALAWLETERRNLLALADQSRSVGEFSVALRHFLDLRGYHDDARTLHTAALTDARATRDHHVEAHALHALGLVYWRWGRYTEAATRFRQAVTVAHWHRHHDIEGYALHHLGCAATRLGRYRDAIEYHRLSLSIARKIGDHDIEGCNLDNLGFVCWRLNDQRGALRYSEQGLMLADRVGNLHVKAHALNNLGLVHVRDCQHERARELFSRALTVARDSGNRYVESNALNGLGTVHRDLGDRQGAREHLQNALDVARDTGNRSHEAEILNNLGGLATNPRDAIAYHHRALAITQATKEPFEQYVAHHHLSEAHNHLSHDLPARYHQQAAQRLYAHLAN